MIKHKIDPKIIIKAIIIIFIVSLCIFLVAYVYIGKPITYQESGDINADYKDPPLVLDTESNIKQGSTPSLSTVKTRIDSPYKENWITTNGAIDMIQAKNSNIISIKSIAPFNSSGQSFGFEIIVNEDSFLSRYIVTGDLNIKKETTQIKAEKISQFPADIPDSSVAVKIIASNPYFSDKNLIGVVIYFDSKLKSWKYIIRTDAGDVSVPLK